MATNPLDPLAPDALYTVCDPAALGFRTTDDLSDLLEPLGQDRATQALKFGIGIKHGGYNVFAYGQPGTGKYWLIRRELEESAKNLPVPDDWVYVHNFAEPHKPNALRLPAGRACPLRADMEKLIAELRVAIPAAFESEDYQARVHSLQAEYAERHEKTFNELQERANARNIALIRTPNGLALAPTSKGEVVSPDVFRQMPDEHQEKVRKDIEELEKELQETLKQLPQWERERRQKLKELNHETTKSAVAHYMSEIRAKYADLANVLTYLDAIEADILENSDDFQNTEPASQQEMMALAMRRSLSGPPSFRRYQVNVIVDGTGAEAAPVVYEDFPAHAFVVGRIEHQAQFGALTTDFNLIKPGALHQSNGGYLILDARKVLTQPFVWDEIKRALQSREIRIQGLNEALGFASTVTLQPQPIPLDLKIVLMGEPMLYYLLSQYDPEFPELFKVAADFDDRVSRDPESVKLYSRLIATMARGAKLKPFEAGAVARVIEHASRHAADSERLTLHMRSVNDLLAEANHWAAQNGNGAVTAADVQRAIDAQIYRADRIRERSLEQIERGTVLIDTKDAVVGQVNGLAVLQLGEFMFGRPSRITARVRLGRGQVIDIEREVALGGPIHSKGVMILSGFLGEKFAKNQPLALSASLVFEQSYGGVDGDSASSTEVYALLSALSGIPIKQCFAVTGSVNQRGEVQAIGGANEKIEGFFDVCKARGLTGEQGVLIPASNVPHLMLRADIVEAARAGTFRIFAVKTIEQGIELLTGTPAGEPGADGKYPAGTVYAKVQAQLAEFAESARKFATHPDGNDRKDDPS